MTGTELISFLSNNFPTISSTVGAVTGALFTAVFLRHNTSVQEFEKIKAGQFKELADTLLSEGKMTFTEYYKANNFLKVAQKADEYYSQMQHDTPVESHDFDWFIRCYEAVGNISDDEMQDLWAKMLAGQIDRPTSFSLRLIDILRNMSTQEARLFQDTCFKAIQTNDNIFMPRNREYMQEFGINYSDIMRLDELGLINSAGSLVLKIPISHTAIHITSNESLIIVAKSIDSSDQTLSVEQYPFTSAGKELASLYGITPSDEQLTTFAKGLQNKSGVKVCLHRIVDRSDGYIQHENTDLLDAE